MIKRPHEWVLQRSIAWQSAIRSLPEDLIVTPRNYASIRLVCIVHQLPEHLKLISGKVSAGKLSLQFCVCSEVHWPVSLTEIVLYSGCGY